MRKNSYFEHIKPKKKNYFVAICVLSLLTCFVGSANAWDQVDHAWMIDKAIEYLKNTPDSVAREYPLDTFEPYFVFGSDFADHNDVKCTWDYGTSEKTYSCDQIHHYGQQNTDIKAWAGGIPSEGQSVANPGEYAAPQYTQVLYDQATDFLPGGDPPDLANLPYTDAGLIKIGYIIDYDQEDLGGTYMGGLPLCEFYYSKITGSPLGPTDACPRWPQWAATDEDGKETTENTANAMTYLGWSVHLVQDMSEPHHARNEADYLHSSFESSTGEWMKDEDPANNFDHLPVSPGGAYHYLPCGQCSNGLFYYQVSPEYFDKTTWSVQQFASEASTLSINSYDGYSIQPSFDAYSDAYWSPDLNVPISIQSIAEQDVDTSIKMSAAVLEKYFREITPSPDELEPNNLFSEAREIGPGSYQGLNLATPKDEDWYKIHISQDSSNLIIDIIYDAKAGTLAGVAEDADGQQYYAQATTDGIRFDLENVPANDYFIHLSPYDLPVTYDMNVAVTQTHTTLPPDYCEDNDDVSNAKEWSSGCGCTITNDLNIDKAGDEDYFSVTVDPQQKFTVSIDYNPAGGNLQLYLDDTPAQVTAISSQENKAEISECGLSIPSIIKVTGEPNYYTMCSCARYDESCGYTPPQPTSMKLDVDTTVPLDYVHILAFSNNNGLAELYMPPDTDGNGGGNIPQGHSTYMLQPLVFGGNYKESDYTLIAQSDENFAVSMLNVPADGDFDTLFPEFNSAGGENGLITALHSDATIQDLMNPCFKLWQSYCPSVFQTAGTPDGLLLTPMGETASVYSFSNGVPIGKITFGESEVPGIIPTTATVTSSVNPSTYGQPVTFTATISPDTASGTVRFIIDDSEVESPIPVSDGTAMFTTSGLAVGTHTVKAEYSGDEEHAPSSAVLSPVQTINQAQTITTEIASSNPSLYSTPVTFTATVAADSPGTGTPTGNVVFTDGMIPLGSSQLNPSAQATLTTSALSAGSHSITALYGGDDNFITSMSTPLNQVIDKATPVITWPLPADIPVGTPLSAAQLDATANVPGTFTYSPPTGTILKAGNAQILSVSFTPTDATNYTTASATVTINVLVPAKVRILPQTINLAGKGALIAVVKLPAGYPATNVDKSTLMCNGAVAKRVITTKKFPQYLLAVFRTSELKGVSPGNKVTLTVSGNLKGNLRFVGVGIVKVIKKGGMKTDELLDWTSPKDTTLLKDYNVGS